MREGKGSGGSCRPATMTPERERSVPLQVVSRSPSEGLRGVGLKLLRMRPCCHRNMFGQHGIKLCWSATLQEPQKDLDSSGKQKIQDGSGFPFLACSLSLAPSVDRLCQGKTTEADVGLRPSFPEVTRVGLELKNILVIGTAHIFWHGLIDPCQMTSGSTLI